MRDKTPSTRPIQVRAFTRTADGNVLAAVVHGGKEAVEALVRFPGAVPGGRHGSLIVTDALDGSVLPWDGGGVRLALPGLGWRLLRLRPEGAAS